jgi:hypothetical protein
MNRNQALSTAGFAVASPRSVSDGPKLLDSDHFGAVLVGNSIPPEVRKSLIRQMRESKPLVPIVFVTVVPGEDEPAADICVDVSKDIGKLIRVLNECMAEPKKAAGE